MNFSIHGQSRMNSNKRVGGRGSVVGGAALFVSLTILVAACSGGAANETTDTPGATVTSIGPENIAIVEQAELATGPSLSGQLTADRSASIRAEVASSAVDVRAEQGERVAAGAVLAKLDDTAIRDAWLSARSGVTSAQTMSDQAQRDLQRAERLLAAGAVAEREVEAARSANISAQAMLADAKARLASAQKQLDATEVKAPFAGVVAERQVSAGDIVAPGTPLFTVVDPASMRLEATIPASSLSEVRAGMPVRFTVSGYGTRSFAGRVSNVNPAADPMTGQVRINVAIPNSGGQLVSGLFAQGQVASETHRALSAPTNAVDLRGLRPFVVRLRGGKVERVEVTVGIRDDERERIEIATGVTAGDTLLVGAAQGFTPGTIVRVHTAADAAPARN
jgi:RND family efflux transporter MFP subunit